MVRRAWILSAFAGCLLGLPAAAEPMDVRGHLPDLRFRLTDDSGRAVTQQTYHGKVVVLAFGYSGCGDACPLTLDTLQQTRHDLGTDDARVQVLFATVTPRTDTPPVLHAWLAPQGVTGLTGDTRTLARTLRAAYPVLSGDPPVHSNALYVFDSEGHARSLVTDRADLTAAIRNVLHDAG